MLFALVLVCLALHLVLPTDVTYLQTHNAHSNASRTHNSTM
jgi:hypothetical protein